MSPLYEPNLYEYHRSNFANNRNFDNIALGSKSHVLQEALRVLRTSHGKIFIEVFYGPNKKNDSSWSRIFRITKTTIALLVDACVPCIENHPFRIPERNDGRWCFFRPEYTGRVYLPSTTRTNTYVEGTMAYIKDHILNADHPGLDSHKGMKGTMERIQAFFEDIDHGIMTEFFGGIRYLDCAMKITVVCDDRDLFITRISAREFRWKDGRYGKPHNVSAVLVPDVIGEFLGRDTDSNKSRLRNIDFEIQFFVEMLYHPIPLWNKKNTVSEQLARRELHGALRK
jgi:hypothetical protein